MQAILKYIKLSLTPEMKQEFYKSLAKRCIIICKIILPAIMLFQAYNMVHMAFFRKNGLSTTPHQVYFLLYVVLFFISLIGFIGLLCWSKKIEKHANTILNLQFVYAFIICLWGACVTLYDQRVTENVSVYLVMVMSIAMLTILKLWQIFIIFPACQVFLIAFFPTFQPEPTNNAGNFINTTVFAIMAVLISCNNYLSAKHSFYNNSLLQEKNNSIELMNQKLQTLAITDSLSGLYNRRFLDDIFPKIWSSCVNSQVMLAVIMIDIDNFKRYNDNFGHQAGDRCIFSIAQLIQNFLKDENSYAFRYGGEEFAIILPGTSEEKALETAQCLCTSVRNYRCGKGEYAATISAGVYCGMPNALTVSREFFALADRALYQAKKNGKNQVQLYQDDVIKEENFSNKTK